MKHFTLWKVGLALFAFTAVGTRASAATVPIDTAAIVKMIKMDVAQVVAGINARDADRATAFDAPDIVSIECGSPPTIGREADKEGFKQGFAHDPNWRISLIDDTVDVATSGDFAVYRGTYNEDGTSKGVVVTHRTTFIAEFKSQSDGEWRMAWYSVSYMEPPHRK